MCSKTVEKNEGKENEEEEYRLEPPNGGFGWWVCFGSALIHVFNLSFNTVFGLLFGPFLESLGEGTSGTVLIVNLSSVAVNLSGLFTGIVLKKFSPRQVTIFGSIVTGLGLVLCAYAEHYWQIILGYSFMVGMGSGLVHPASFLALDSFFTTKKTRAMGFSHSGASIGHIIIPNFVTFLLEHYGFRKTVLAKGALSICGIIGGAFFQPVEKYLVRVKVGKEKPEKFQYKDFENDIQEKPKIETIFSIDQEKLSSMNEKTANLKELEINQKKSKEKILSWSKLSELMDLKLLKCPEFLIIALGIGICFTATINFAFILPFFLQHKINLDIHTSAFCISVIAGADFVARITFPFITERLKLSNKSQFLIGAVFMCLFRGIMAENSSYQVILINCVAYGYFKALVMVNQGLVVSQYCASNAPGSLPGALGLLMLSRGLCIITIGQFLGWIRDYSGSYSLCLHVQNIFILLVVFLWVSAKFCKKSDNKKTVTE